MPDESQPAPVDAASPQAIPRWAWLAAALLVAASLAVLVWGRGGTMVLAGAALAFAALAVLLLSVPDGDPAAV
ncbi:MAG: hypothetical protein HY332_09495 [Chloroflexi bacterium]|nr:hypothetical protein [Chloroflexota bacterium]